MLVLKSRTTWTALFSETFLFVAISLCQCHAVNRNLVGVVNMIDMPKYDPFLPMNSLSSGLAESCTLSTTLEDGNNAGGPDPGSVGNDRSAKTPSAEEHWEVIERILFIYYKTHTGQGYVQGMNELIAPIYFVFATDPDEQCRRKQNLGDQPVKIVSRY